jgi:predicted Rossmann fold nucleotide-binding protein DprA/Smf involved in DNA uptake
MSAEPTALSDDAIATVLVASYLGLPPRADAEPFGPVGWYDLAAALLRAGRRPQHLLGADVETLRQDLDLAPATAERIARLTERAGAIGFDLDRLAQRGIWVLTRGDREYPSRLAEQLGKNRPPVLFGAGPREYLSGGGLAVVGSRDVDETGAGFARRAGMLAAASGMNIVSGGARGVDRLAMEGAIAAEGVAAGILTDSLERWLKDPDLRRYIHEGLLVLATPFKPDAGFNARNAMARNKVIHALADYALVVASDKGKGGTWGGAIENLKANWSPLFVRSAPDAPEGNAELIRRGGIPLTSADLDADDLGNRLAALRDASRADGSSAEPSASGQMALFGDADAATADDSPGAPRKRSRKPAAD